MRSLFLLLVLISFSAGAQPDSISRELLPTETHALFKLRTAHMDGEQPRAGERITFLDKKTREQMDLITDQNGEAKVLLPKGHSYGVYNTFLNSSKPISALDVPDARGELIFKMKLQWDLTNTKFKLDNVRFDSGKSTLRSQSYETLAELVDYLSSHPKMTIEIQGHTDNQGASASNLELSERRAQAVKSYLIKRGIAEQRIHAKGYGEDLPVSSNDTAEGRQTNRRTEVLILSEE